MKFHPKRPRKRSTGRIELSLKREKWLLQIFPIKWHIHIEDNRLAVGLKEDKNSRIALVTIFPTMLQLDWKNSAVKPSGPCALFAFRKIVFLTSSAVIRATSADPCSSVIKWLSNDLISSVSPPQPLLSAVPRKFLKCCKNSFLIKAGSSISCSRGDR